MTEAKSESHDVEGDADNKTARLVFEGLAWLVGYACARRTSIHGFDGAIGEANQVADAFVKRFGDDS